MDVNVKLLEHRRIVLQQNAESGLLVWFLSIEYYVSITVHLLLALLSAGPILMWPTWLPAWVDYVNNRALYFSFNIYFK